MHIFCCFHDVSPGFFIDVVFPPRFVLDVEARLFTKCFYVCMYVCNFAKPSIYMYLQNVLSRL